MIARRACWMAALVCAAATLAVVATGQQTQTRLLHLSLEENVDLQARDLVLEIADLNVLQKQIADLQAKDQEQDAAFKSFRNSFRTPPGWSKMFITKSMFHGLPDSKTGMYVYSSNP